MFSLCFYRTTGRKSLCIKVQQDNAGPHVSEDNKDIMDTGLADGWTIEMACQPPRSPDLNVLDLGIFNAIQSVQYRWPTNKLDDLVVAVDNAFHSIPAATIDKCFVTLQKVLQCIIASGGGNDYKLPRVSKKHIVRGSATPLALPISKEVVLAGMRALQQ